MRIEALEMAPEPCSAVSWSWPSLDKLVTTDELSVSGAGGNKRDAKMQGQVEGCKIKVGVVVLAHFLHSGGVSSLCRQFTPLSDVCT